MKKSSPKKPRPFIAYYRVSTGKQGVTGLGIKAQKTAVKNHLKTKYPPNYEFIEAESGKKTKRPQLAKALDLAKKKKGVLIVAKLDRLSRDLHFITSLEKSKIDFICCDYPSMDKLQLHIMGSIAQWEREQISRRTKLALAELKKQGIKLGWHNPKIRAGIKAYWKTRKKPKPIKPIKKTPSQPPKVMSQADQFAENMRPVISFMLNQGLTLEEIAKELKKMKIKTRRGYRCWRVCQVVRLRDRLGL